MWRLGLPSSSSHALIGGLIGAALAQSGSKGVQWHGLVHKVLIPAVFSPMFGFLLAFAILILIYWLFSRRRPGTRIAASGSARSRPGTFVAFVHGANDSQKTMGVISLALYEHGTISSFYVPTWVKIAAGLAIGAGTYAGGWRVMRTLGQRVFKIDPPSGFAAQAAGGDPSVATRFGYPVSTTHTISGAVMGAGATKRLLGCALGRRREHRRRVGAHDPGGGARLRRCVVLAGARGSSDAARARTTARGEIFALLGEAGEAVLADRRRLVERRFLEWPSGPSQDEVKRARARRRPDHLRAAASMTNVDVRHAVRPRRPGRRSRSRSTTSPTPLENAAELLGLYGVETPTRQSFELCALLVQATEQLAHLLARPAGASRVRPEEIEADLGDRGSRQTTVARAARAEPVQGRIGSTRWS